MMTLREYQNMREDQWDATIGKAIKERRRRATYGTVSADAIIARFRKYEKEYNKLTKPNSPDPARQAAKKGTKR